MRSVVTNRVTSRTVVDSVNGIAFSGIYESSEANEFYDSENGSLNYSISTIMSESFRVSNGRLTPDVTIPSLPASANSAAMSIASPGLSPIRDTSFDSPGSAMNIASVPGSATSLASVFDELGFNSADSSPDRGGSNANKYLSSRKVVIRNRNSVMDAEIATITGKRGGCNLLDAMLKVRDEERDLSNSSLSSDVSDSYTTTEKDSMSNKRARTSSSLSSTSYISASDTISEAGDMDEIDAEIESARTPVNSNYIANSASGGGMDARAVITFNSPISKQISEQWRADIERGSASSRKEGLAI